MYVGERERELCMYGERVIEREREKERERAYCNGTGSDRTSE